MINSTAIDFISTLNGGSGNDTLVYNFTTQAGASGLESFVNAAANNQVTGFENLVLDMSNAEDDKLELASMLDALQNTAGDGTSNKIFINGDPTDNLNLGTGWTQSQGQVEHFNGIDYNIYVNNEAETIYIQQTIATIRG